MQQMLIDSRGEVWGVRVQLAPAPWKLCGAGYSFPPGYRDTSRLFDELEISVDSNKVQWVLATTLN